MIRGRYVDTSFYKSIVDGIPPPCTSEHTATIVEESKKLIHEGKWQVCAVCDEKRCGQKNFHGDNVPITGSQSVTCPRLPNNH